MGRQQTTNADTEKWALNPQQEAAVSLLAGGSNVTETAEAVSVARQTVSEWLHHHAGFRAALNRQRGELRVQLTNRLTGLLPKAVEVLQRELDTEGARALNAAVHLLKASGMYGLKSAIGYTEAEDFEIADREEEGDRQRRLMFATLV